jgi:hypothetical protein
MNRLFKQRIKALEMKKETKTLEIFISVIDEHGIKGEPEHFLTLNNVPKRK